MTPAREAVNAGGQHHRGLKRLAHGTGRGRKWLAFMLLSLRAPALQCRDGNIIIAAIRQRAAINTGERSI
jgi:hypothetical protein